MKKFFVLGIIISAILATILLFLYKNRDRKLNLLVPCTIKHLGVIMDGNRRWARRSGMPASFGHRQGVNPVKTTIKFCLKHNIPYLTLYAFSLENFKRSEEELSYLFNVLAHEMAGQALDELHAHKVQIRFVGDINLFPPQLDTIVQNAQEKTSKNTALILSILFCYGGQQEIIATTKKLATAAQEGTLDPNTITQELFERYTWFGALPAPDLIIRTGKAQRLSNFLTFQSAYSELYFLPCYWPEVTEAHLID